jgi:hypothetical protein
VEQLCRFSPPATSAICADLAICKLSHAIADSVCLTERFISYDGRHDAALWPGLSQAVRSIGNRN